MTEPGSLPPLPERRLEILWYLIAGDGRYPWDPAWRRRVDFEYVQAWAKSIDVNGFYGALLATQPTSGMDPWITAASLVPTTRRMKFVIAVHPSVYTPTSLVKLATTLDQNSGGRVVLNVVSGHTGLEAAGVHLKHEERYEHTDEFLTVYRALMRGERVDFDGRHLKIRGAEAAFLSLQQPYPPLWFGGASPIARDVAAKHIDNYLTWGEPPAETAELIADVRARAAKHGRSLRFGIRLNLIVRDTDEEAWAAAQDMLDHLDDDVVARVQAESGRQESVGQARQLSFHKGVKPRFAQDLEVYPNVWSGFGLIRGGPGLALVGSPESVAARIREYHALGIDSFIVSGNPLLEETYRFGAQVMPLLPVTHDDPGALRPAGYTRPKPAGSPPSGPSASGPAPSGSPLVAAG
ncbi:LLM class flavin-dependent oxidoreductase [Microbispora amethystogenes]|uniref:LLM class flavin-dependent oxidoreductase n=1 Tax=Microbispora amethystogenes TaxID=1427754 RepID=UPI0033DE37F1